MNNSDKYYVEKVAQAARKSALRDPNINLDPPLSIETIKKVIEHFGGELNEKTDSDQTHSDFYIKKNDNEELEIYYNAKATDNIILNLLHELGHVFFDFPNMNKGEIKCCDDAQATDEKANLFARAFLMPRDKFEKDMVECTTIDGKFDMIKLAKRYSVSYMDTLTRGEDLNLWH